MKKVLFATTALVATAGVAAADVTFGGYGRFGVFYDDNGEVGGTGISSTDVTSRFRLQIDATAESDMGVTMGARARIQQNETDALAESANSGTGINGVRFFARSGGLEVAVGNIFGALEFMPGQYSVDMGLTGLGYDYTVYNFRADAYQSGSAGAAGQNGVEVLYSMGDFSFHLSASDENNRVAGYAAYTFSGWTVAAALQDSSDPTDTEWSIAAEGSLGFADLGVAYADNGTDGDHWSLMARFDVGAATNVEVFVADADYFSDTAYGVDFNHNLGGGTSLRGGIVNRGSGAVNADLGVRFNF